MISLDKITSTQKIIAGVISAVAAIAGLIVTLNTIKNNIYQDGYNKAVADIQEQQNKLFDEKIAVAEKGFRDSLEAQETLHQMNIERLKSEQTVKIETQEVVKYVDKIVVKNECVSLAADTVWMLGQAAGVVSGAATSKGGKAKAKP